jgi:Type IV secretion system pilin
MRRVRVRAAVVLAAVAVVLLISTTPAWAKPPEGPNDLPTIIHNARVWVVGILAALATLFFTLGGVRYLMANGDPGEIERAKSAFRGAAFGYGLAIIAPILLQVVQDIVGG